jgi:hypothetical protein
MPPRRDGVKHARVVPCVDVAACGERGEHLRFSVRLKDVDCGVCMVRRMKSIASKRGREEFAARVRSENGRSPKHWS